MILKNLFEIIHNVRDYELKVFRNVSWFLYSIFLFASQGINDIVLRLFFTDSVLGWFFQEKSPNYFNTKRWIIFFKIIDTFMLIFFYFKNTLAILLSRNTQNMQTHFWIYLLISTSMQQIHSSKDMRFSDRFRTCVVEMCSQ